MSNFHEKKQCRKIRHPTEENVKSPTYTPSFISLGNKERTLLMYLYNNQKTRFNVKAFSKNIGWGRATVYDALNTLSRKGLVDLSELANKKITEKGKTAIEVSDGGVGSLRRECRSPHNLSKHDSRYQVEITDRKAFDQKIKEYVAESLGAFEYKPVKLPNMTQHIFKMHEASIIVKKNIAVIRIHEIIAEDTDEASFQSIMKAIDLQKKLYNIGLKSESLKVEGAHYARVSSYLSEFLEKIDDRYFVDLGDGKKFWIDRSHPEAPEDETNDEEVRERLDKHLKAMTETDSTIDQLDDVKEIMNDVIKYTLMSSKKINTTFDVVGKELGVVSKSLMILSNNTNNFVSALTNGCKEQEEMDDESKKLTDYIC